MSNVLSESKREQVIALGRLKWSLRRIERETGVRRETAAGYLKAAGIGVRYPGAWGRKPPSGEPAGQAKPANEVTPGSAPNPAIEIAPPTPGPEPESTAPEAAASACAPYGEWIQGQLDKGRNAKAIWQDLVDSHGFTASYQSVKRFVHKLHGSPSAAEPRAVIITPPGEEAQVDYGDGPLVRDPQSGRYRRTRLFVPALGYSRKCVRLIVFNSSSRAWAELHEKAFARLRGSPRLLVLDNLKEGVLKPDIWDPTINPLYGDMLGHYGAVAMPCRKADPDRKGKVESSVKHAQSTPLKGQRFESLAEAQAYLDHWEEKWADTRIHGTTKRQVAAMFAEERPSLRPLPTEPFRYYGHGQRSVHPDGCVEVAAAYYSAPLGWIGRRVNVQWDDRHVRLLDPRTGQLLREHLRQPRGTHRILTEDKPARTPPAIEQLLRRAANAGEHTGRFCQTLYAEQGQAAVRRIQGILALATKYGAEAADDACAAAIEYHVHQYHFVRRYLERKAPAPVPLRQVDPLIRQLTLYRDFIDNSNPTPTGENDPL